MSKKSKPVEAPPADNPSDSASIDPGKPARLRITCTHEGFRRAGRAWSATPTEVHVDEFTEIQLRQLFAEPRLTIEAVG